jgi:hypothetical protein
LASASIKLASTANPSPPTSPAEIEHGGDLAHQVIVRYNLVELELVEARK